MKTTFRALDRIRLVLLEENQGEHGLAVNEPDTITPLELRSKIYEVDKGLQDMLIFYRGDTIPIEATLLDFRGNPHPALATALSFQLAVKKLVPVPQQLFVIDGTLVAALTGRVDFVVGPTETNQVDVDEAVASVRIEVAAGEYRTFEPVSAFFKDSAFS